jgi:tetratricopeptide (TPR) repeat protein
MRIAMIVLAAAALLLVAGASQARKRDRTPEAERLLDEGADRWSQGTFEERRKAIDAMEQAAKLTPRDTHVLSRLAHAYLDAGYSHDAKEMFEHITALDPGDADAWEGLGRVWKRDWLATLATAPLEKSIHYLDEAVRQDPARAEAWTMLVVLRLERSDPNLAAAAAAQALAAAPDSAARAGARGRRDRVPGRAAGAGREPARWRSRGCDRASPRVSVDVSPPSPSRTR